MDRRSRAGLLGELARVLVPLSCAGCGAFDVVLCSACRALLSGPLQRCEADAPRLDRLDGSAPVPVWACAPYTGPVRELVVAWKDRGRTDLSTVLGGALADGAARLAPAFAAALGQGAAGLASAITAAPDPAGAGRSGELLVVGAPSSSSAVRSRGSDLVAELAGASADGFSRGGVEAVAVRGLRQRRGVRDQVGLGARERGRNLGGRVQVRPGSSFAGRLVVVVDDVLTTGATLAACAGTLERDGALVLGALVLAATPSPARHRSVTAVPTRHASGPRAGWGAPGGIR